MKGLKNLYKWGKKYILYIFLIIGLNALLQWLYSYLPLFVQYVFKLLRNEDLNVNLPKWLTNFYDNYTDIIQVILIVASSMIALQAVRSILRFINNYLTGFLTEKIANDMRINLYDHIGDLSYTYHNRVDTGDLIQRSTSDIDTSSGFFSGKLPDLFNIFFTIFIGAMQVYKINPTLMWVSLIIVPISGISSVIYFKYVYRTFKRIEDLESNMTTIIQENVNSSRVVRAFSNEKFEFEKMDKANKSYSDSIQKFSNMMAIYWGSSDGMVMLQYVLTFSVGIILAKQGLVDVGDITACLLLMGMLIWPIRGLGRIIAEFGKTIVALGRIEEVLEEPSEFIDNGTLMPQINGNIEFKNVKFKFDDDNKSLLNGISFNINAGETIAIVGKTGSGKSTICNLLTRMLEYNDGSIKIDGIELKEIEKRYLRKNIKIVLQDPFLYSKTVYENIGITTKAKDETSIHRASKIASLHDEVMKFENGYDTLVGEKGTTLSGGQKQRVAIARILVDESPIIIFDDSLSALDTKTDLMIRSALKNKDKKQTMIIITHRTTTAKEADKIIVLDNGTISQIGTHEELVKLDGLYKDLWGIQGELEEEFYSLLGGEF